MPNSINGGCDIRSRMRREQKRKWNVSLWRFALCRINTIRFSLFVCHLSSCVWTDALETHIKSFCSFFRTLHFDSTDYSMHWQMTLVIIRTKTNRRLMWPERVAIGSRNFLDAILSDRRTRLFCLSTNWRRKRFPTVRSQRYLITSLESDWENSFTLKSFVWFRGKISRRETFLFDLTTKNISAHFFFFEQHRRHVEQLYRHIEYWLSDLLVQLFRLDRIHFEFGCCQSLCALRQMYNCVLVDNLLD